MQLYALDSSQRLVFAKHAFKQQDYYCLECKATVHVRGGMHRQTHFYHCSPLKECRQHSKSMQHLQVQFYLQSLLPKKECTLEHRFPDIGRIADVLWETQKIIFEIQCSPISSAEVLARNADYAKKGYQVIWIFHDFQFNQWKLSSAENALHNSPHYFTNMDAHGNGMIYDLFSFYQNGLRKKITPPFTIHPNQPKTPANLSTLSNPILKQRQQWPVHFSGDVLDRFLNDLDPTLHKISELTSLKQQFSLRSFLDKWFLRPYFLAFQIILERFCR